MKILILTQWYPPEPAALMHEMAVEMISRGHEVQVLTGFPNYPSGDIYPGYQLRLWQHEVMDGVDIARVWLYPDHSQSGVKRILNYLSFAVSSLLLGPFIRSRPDVIFVYHPPLTVGMPAWWLSLIWQRPFVYQIQDMWPETLAATGMIQNHTVLGVVGWAARQIYRRATKIIVISKGFRENLLSKNVPAEKIEIISNWVDPAAYHPAARDAQLAQQLGLADKLNVMFAGNIGEAQGLETLVSAAEILRHRDDIRFVIVGDGVALTRLRAFATEKELTNVVFLGRFRPDEMPPLYALADILFLHLKDEPLFRITIPHKIFAYMASAKPILAGIAGDAAVLVGDSGAGLVCEPENPASLAAAVVKLSEMDAEKLEQMGKNGRQFVLENYNRTYLVSQIENVLRGI